MKITPSQLVCAFIIFVTTALSRFVLGEHPDLIEISILYFLLLNTATKK